jgi:hypothetical protein
MKYVKSQKKYIRKVWVCQIGVHLCILGAQLQKCSTLEGKDP